MATEAPQVCLFVELSDLLQREQGRPSLSHPPCKLYRKRSAFAASEMSQTTLSYFRTENRNSLSILVLYDL